MTVNRDVSYGVVQGRLLPPVDDMIQVFPHDNWRDEFLIARNVGCDHIEWIVSESTVEDFNRSPFSALHRYDVKYIENMGIVIDTVCFDGLMQYDMLTLNAGNPDHFYKFRICVEQFVAKCLALGVKRIVLPFLERASALLPSARANALHVIELFKRAMAPRRISLSVETDLPHDELLSFVCETDDVTITFDSGNLLRLGYDVRTHAAAYGGHVDNVHVKNMTRPFGTTTSLFDRVGMLAKQDRERVFSELRDAMIASGRQPRFTFQTARDPLMSESKLFLANKRELERMLEQLDVPKNVDKLNSMSLNSR